MSTAAQLLALVVSVVVTFAAAGIGGAGTAVGLREWYPSLVKPAWNPPNWVFGPVWSLLYSLMAVSAWLAWRAGAPLWAYGLQLGLNTLWSLIFFLCRSPRGALVDVVALWGAILATIVVFGRHSHVAAWLLVPYLAWVTFATVLNGAIVWLNW